ncbi:CAP domain-containing protein [Streptomyces sp. MMS24-I2-30]|uniref:CAP domain-containing protein n=1 Tax=Streptomyces sp. MMS24-I2-30 TaxID=3351564 RepID=UPI003896CF1E
MGNHRKSNTYRRILVAALAVGVVGVPSAAMARADWPSPGGSGQQSGNAANAAGTGWWSNNTWHRDWNQGANQQWPAPGGGGRGGAAGRPPAGGPQAPGGAAQAPGGAPQAPGGAPEQPPAGAPGQPTAAPDTSQTGAPEPWSGPPSKPTHHHHWKPKPPSEPAPEPSASTAAPAPSDTPADSPSPSATDSPSPSATDTGSATADRILELVNAERGKAGCSDLKLNDTLTKAAQAHSDDMAAHKNMSHTGSDGTSPGDRITKAGYTWSAYGENVAYGFSTPEQVMSAWMSSPGHKANILNCGFKEIGVGLSQPGSYWTQDFGTPK